MKIVTVLGPTGIGKSELSLMLSARFDGEILCVDSRTIYKRIDIGTAKPSSEDREKTTHHLLDILELKDKCDAAWFSKIARKTIEDVRYRGKLPVLTGGSGMYLKAILEGLFDIDLDEEERREFSARTSRKSTRELYSKLTDIDGESAGRINCNDRQRIMRALEVYELSGITLSAHFKKQDRKENESFESVKIGLNAERRVLHERINIRTSRMLEIGWIDEVRDLLSEGVDPECPGMKTLGYPEIVAHLRGELDYDSTLEKISAKTRQYAKRQLTWFRKESGVYWIDIVKTDAYAEAVKFLDMELKN